MVKIAAPRKSLAEISARRAERFASAGNHAGQSINDAFCTTVLGLAHLLQLISNGLVLFEQHWRDVRVTRFEPVSLPPLKLGRHLEVR